MAQIVVKFGGSNLKTPADIRRSVQVACTYKDPLVVVVSALSGVTDLLVKATEESLLYEGVPETLCHRLEEIHAEAVAIHLTSERQRATLLETLTGRLNQLRRLLTGIHYIGAVPDFTKDQILSFGERLSAPIIAAVLKQAGLPAEEMLPEDIGLLTDGCFGNAAANLATCQKSLSVALHEGCIPVIPGFYGINQNGNITIFGRGGSDYTAAVIARSINAKSLDLWKDVDGFLSCDPRIVKDSKTIPYLTYAEAAELAYFGAKVLHPRTVEPLESVGIPIRVMNVEKFEGAIAPYSIVGPEINEIVNHTSKHEKSQKLVKSIAATDDVGIVRLEGPGVGSRPGILARATSGLDEAGINISSVITSQTSINLLFKRGDLHKALAVLRSESVPSVVAVEKIDDISIVAVVGSGIRHTPGLASQVLGALASRNINVLLTQAGASPVAIYVIVRSADKQQAVAAIHDAFFELFSGECYGGN
ncbi:MAG: aspartate kinase [Termitinemataceae bacterium]